MLVHLIDGTYELYRAHFGQPSATAPDGREVGAARGLLRMLGAFLRGSSVTHVAIAFDHVIESFRNDLFDGYKTSEGVPPELFAQFELAEQVAAALGMVVWPMVEFEADDALATAAARFAREERVEQVRICSRDKDLAQCVQAARVVLWDRFADTVLDEDGVRSKFGVSPASIPDFLALVGDTADGIPGVPRWGEKSAATMLARWEHFDDIPADEARWEVKVRGAAALAQSLRAHREQAALYRRLATLRCDVPLSEDLGALEWKGGHRAKLEELATVLGDPKAGSRVARLAD